MLKGIDVSVYQRDADFQRIAADGIDFAIIKASQGSLERQSTPPFSDAAFDHSLSAATNAGIACGAYHYFTARTEKETDAEAAFFLNLLAPRRSKIKLFAAVDVESSRLSGLSREGLSALVLRFCDRVREGGFAPIVYTNRNFLTYRLVPDFVEKCDLWQAHWTSSMPTDAGAKLLLWQYGLTNVSGIASGVDGDYAIAQNIVVRATGYEQQTVNYVNRYLYAKDLWEKLARAMLHGRGKPTSRTDYDRLVCDACKYEEQTRLYMNQYRYAKDFFRKAWLVISRGTDPLIRS